MKVKSYSANKGIKTYRRAKISFLDLHGMKKGLTADRNLSYKKCMKIGPSIQGLCVDKHTKKITNGL